MMVGDQGVEKVCEGSEGGLSRLRAVEVPVVDRLAIRWVSQ